MDCYQPRFVCVLRLSALGDCINAYGMIGGIKKAYPETHISWIIDSRFAPLFVDADQNELTPLYKVNFKRHGITACYRLKKELGQRRFDCLFNIQTSIKSSITSLAVKAGVKMGYDKERSREGQRFFINAEAKSPEDPHVLSGFMAFAHEAGFVKAQPYWDFNLKESELKEASEYFDSRKIFLLSPCSSKAYKNWTIEGYTAIASYAKEKGFCVALTGSPNPYEEKICSIIAKSLGKGVVNLCGRTSLRQLLAVTKISSLVLAPDNAAVHLANALNVPVIGLYGIHSEKRVGPTRFMDLCVSVYDEAAREELGSQKIPWRYRVKNQQVLERITIGMVKDAFDKAQNHILGVTN